MVFCFLFKNPRLSHGLVILVFHVSSSVVVVLCNPKMTVSVSLFVFAHVSLKPKRRCAKFSAQLARSLCFSLSASFHPMSVACLSQISVSLCVKPLSRPCDFGPPLATCRQDVIPACFHTMSKPHKP